MDRETEKLKASTGEMQKRRVTMEDGRRYLIYYSFDRAEPAASAGPETKGNPPEGGNQTSEGNK